MAALLAVPILGEWPALMDWIAIALISVGVYVVSGGPLPGKGAAGIREQVISDRN
jgi:drug/metabolite transporter (DMT)-like permease